MTVKEIVAMNPDLEGSAKALAGKTIVLPGDKLSQRDKEILAGMAQGKGKGYRIYPVGGEGTLVRPRGPSGLAL